MIAQAFFYNAIFFTYALVLTEFYDIPADHIGWYVCRSPQEIFLGRCCSVGCSTRWADGR